MDYLKEIDNGLIIEKPKIVLPWTLQKKDLFYKISDISKVNENYYTLNVVLPEISFVNCIGLHFQNERLSEIELFNNEKMGAEPEIGNIFKNHQLILENSFGVSRRNKLSNFFKGCNKEYRWQFKHITIIHKLWDRFGMEEVLKIYIKR